MGPGTEPWNPEDGPGSWDCRIFDFLLDTHHYIGAFLGHKATIIFSGRNYVWAKACFQVMNT